MNNQQGSILILTIISAFILSVLVIGLMTVGGTESSTTQNHFLKKNSFYQANHGTEVVRQKIFDNPNPITVENIEHKLTMKPKDGINSGFITGTMEDMQKHPETEVQKINRFAGFKAPELLGIGRDINTGPIPVIYNVYVTSVVRPGKMKKGELVTDFIKKNASFTEINAGIYSYVITSHVGSNQ
jgi:hypothetical protein